MPFLKKALLLLCSTVVFAGGSRLTPDITAIALDGTFKNRMPQVHVVMMVKRNLMSSYTEVAAGQTNTEGLYHFPAYRGKKFHWVALSFSWKPQFAPERHLLFEMKLKKGNKGSDGLQMTPKTTYGSFDLDGFYTSDCSNLFEMRSSAEGIEVVLHVPQSYADCKNPVKDRINLAEIGTRDLNETNLNYFDFNKDVQMGAQFYQSMNATPENRPLRDPLVVGYINDMVNRLVKASDMPQLKFTVTVLDADIMNAFALPGGFIFVYRGLIEKTETESELAGVLAHEIGHVCSRHGTEGVTSAINKMLIATTLGEIAAHNMKGEDRWLVDLARVAIFSGTQFWVLGGTRKREAEADFLGTEYAWKAGYDPGGMASLFSRWAEQREGKQTRLDQFFSDHPNDLNRVKSIQEQIGYFMPPRQGEYHSSTEYQQVKARLQQLPPPVTAGATAANAIFSSFQQTNENLILQTMEGYFSGQQ